MTAVDAGRMYRFAPRDRAGWLLGLSGAQCMLAALGVVVAGLALRLGAPAPVAGVPLVVCAVAGFASSGGQPTYAQAAVYVGWWRARRTRRWHAPLRDAAAAPPVFGDIRLVEIERPAWAAPGVQGVAVVVDAHASTVTGALGVRGDGFSLASRGDQETMVAGWGDVLSGFCAERGRVARLSVTEWTAPVGTLPSPTMAGNDGPAAAYAELVDVVASAARSHEVVITVTVTARKTRRGPDAAAVDVLLDELRALHVRLDAAGLWPTPPLSPAELATALRVRVDPACRPALTARATSLADAAGLRAPTPWPLALDAEWGRVRTDGSLHAAWWVAEWPRLDVGPAWFEPLVAADGICRTVVLYIEPVAPSVARRRIERDATRLATDAEQRSQRGFRIGAGHRRNEAAVVEREAELVSGYAEVQFVGLVIVTAPTGDELAIAGAAAEQAAASAGLELRRLDGRHDLALAAALPLGRPIAQPKLT
jgi:hypothetical protein